MKQSDIALVKITVDNTEESVVKYVRSYTEGLEKLRKSNPKKAQSISTGNSLKSPQLKKAFADTSK